MPRFDMQSLEEMGSSIDTNPITNPNGAAIRKKKGKTAASRTGQEKTFAQMNEQERLAFIARQRRVYERRQEEIAGVQAMAAGEATEGIIPHPATAAASRENTPRQTAEEYWAQAEAEGPGRSAAQQTAPARGEFAQSASSYLTGRGTAAMHYGAAAQGQWQEQQAQQQKMILQQRQQMQQTAQNTAEQTELPPEYWAQAARAAAEAQDKEAAFETFNAYMDANPLMKDLFAIDTGTYQPGNSETRQVVNPAGRFGMMPEFSGSSQVQAYRDQILAGMTQKELAVYRQMTALYDSYGKLWSMGHRAVQDVTGLAQQVGGSFVTIKDAAAQAVQDAAEEAGSEENKAIAQAIMRMDELQRSGRMFETDGNGQRVLSREYRTALNVCRNAQRAANQYYRGTVLTPENSPGVALYQAGSERVANAQAGLGDGAKFAVNTANSIVGNAPAMALAAVPVVGQAASLGLMGAQAAGGRAAELSMEGETATRALTRGLVSGGIEVLTEKVPVGEWVNLVKGPAREGVQQAVMAVLRQMGSEATEEAASYVLNYAADVAAQDPNAEFSLAELAENALGGAISGGVYGGVGVGVNRMLNRGVRTQQNAGQDAAEPAPQDAPQEGAGTAQAAAAEADGTQEGRQGEAAAEAENGQPRTTYEQAQAAELGRLFGLQPNAAAAKMQQDAGSAAPVQQGTVSAGAAQNQRQVEQLAAELELPEQAARTLAADYDGSASPAVYAKAWTDAYDAGRTGSLTEAQALRAAGSAAAVAGQEDALRRAYALGAQEAGNLAGAAPAGTAQRGGTVEYQGTGASVVPDEVLQAVAARYGVDVDVVNELASEDGRAANGMWAAGIARITLGENSGNSYQTLNHELTHYIDSVNPEGWARLKNQILVYAASQGMNELQAQAIGPYEGAYGRGAIAADEAARDILAGVMSTEENVQTFCEHVAADQTASPQEKRSILQALRDMLDKVVQTLRSLVHRGDAAAGSEYGRRLAEAQDSRALVETYLAELDAAAEVQRGGVQEARQQNAPAASAGAQAYSIDPNFDREIVAWDEEGRNGRRIFRLGSTGEALQSIGVQDRSIVMVSDKVRTILREHPNVTIDMIRQIPAMLENPVLVLESQGRSMLPGTRQNSRIVVVGNVTDANSAPVLCILDLAPQSAQDRRLGLQDFNKVSSAYPKDVNPAGFLQNSNVLYANPDTNKTQDALSSFGFKFATSELNHLGSMGSIAYSGNDVKIHGVPFEEAFGAAQDGTSSARRKPAVTYEQAMADEMGRLFGLQPSANTDGNGNTAAESAQQSAESTNKKGNAQYSRAETDARRDLARENRELARRNMHLEEQVQLLKEETQLSEGHRIDPRRVDELARWLVREYESGYDASQLKGELTRLFDYIANDPEANYTDAMDTAQRLMRGVLEQSRRANTELRDAYKPVRDDLRSMTIEVQKESPAYYELLNEYGDGPGGRRWGNVRRNTFGRVNLKLVDGPGNWDTQFAELAENHPAVFDAEAGAAENVAAALGVFEASEVSYDNPYGMDLDTAAENAAQELFEAYMEMPERHTYADRQRQKALETRTRYREQRQRALAEQKGRYENRLAELRQKNAGQIQAMRDENAKKLVEQKAVFDERMARRNEGLRYRQARDQAEKNLRRLHRWLVQPTDAQHVPEKMRGAVAEVLKAINFNTHNAGSRADTDLKLALRDIQSLVADPDPSGDSLEYADFDPDLKDMIDEFIDSAPKDREGRISAKDLSAVQMQQLNGVLTSVTHSITTANRLLAEGRNTKLADVAAKSVEEIGSRTESRLRERRGWVKKVMDSDLGERAENLAGLDMMDAGSYFRSLGPAAEKIFGAIREGFNTRVFKIRAGQEFMQNLLRGKKLAEWSGDKAPKQTFALEKGGTLELTPGQAMELYCLTQRKQAHQHLVQGGVVLETRPGKLSARVALTPTDIAKITGSLTPEQVRVAQQMQKYLSTTVAGWGNETSMELYGIRKFGEKNYWPIKSSDNYTRTNDANSGGEPGLWGIKNAGMTKAVKINANNPLVLHDAFDTWYNHVAQMASYNAWAIPLSDAMKWYNWHDANNTSVKEAIEGLYGSKGKSYFTTLMKDLNGMSDKPSQTGFERLTGSLTRTWKVAKVGANLRVIIQQPTSYLRAAAVISPKYLTQALSQAPAHLKEGIRNAEKYSAISQWANWGFFETNLGQSMRSVMIGDQAARERLQELATAPAGAMDRMTRGVLWLACEDEVRAAQPELKGEALMQAVAKRLDEVIDRTQVVDTVLHRSHIMRSKNGLTQMAMNFMAEPTKTWNMMREAAVGLAHTQPKSEARAAAGKKLARVTGTYIVTALGTAAAAALVDSWRVKDEDKDKEWLERYGQAVFENWQDNVNLLGSLPLVKDIFSLLQGYDIERTDMAAFADMIDSVSVLWKAVQGEGNASAYDLIRALAEPVSGLTGVPVSNAARELKSIYDFATQLQDPLRLDRSLYADPEAVTYLDMVAQVRGEGGNLNRLKQLYGTSGSGAATYTEMLGGDQAEKVDRWLTALSEKTGEDGKANTAVLPKRVSNKVSWSQDGQDMLVYLSGPEYLAYAESVQKTSCKLIADYMAGAGAEAEPEEQAKFVKAARDYAVQAARAEAIPDYAVDDWVADIQAQGGDVAKLLTARLTIQEAESDRDAEGNAISGSRTKNAVQELVAQGYNVAEARAMYEGTTNADDSRYLQLYDDVKGNSRQANELAALFGAAGEDATYAGMLGQGNAKRVDTYLQNLARTAGDDVLPDYMAAMFSYTKDGESQKVELNGREYIEYAGQRTETAYDLLSLFMTDAKRFDSDLQADMVRSVENYATQTAKAEVSDYEPDSWVQKVQAQAGTSTGDIYTLLLARQLIYAAEGQKDANGKTISGTKKAAAIRNLENAGYSQAYAQELYKLFG